MKIHHFPYLLVFLFMARGAFAQDTTATKAIDSAAVKTIDSTALQIAEPLHEPKPQLNVGHFSASPSIGFTYQGISKDGDESDNLQYLSSLQAKLSHEGKGFQFNCNLYLQYGAQISREKSPQKTQDVFQLSLVPSMTLSDKLGLRLFFEVTGETEMGVGEIDGVTTKFLDPLFIYETLFIGHKSHIISSDGMTDLEFILGVGYAYQQTMTNRFILEQNRQFVDNSGLLSDVQAQFTIEKGYSGILEVNLNQNLGNAFSFRESFKAVALTKDNFTQNVKNSRIGCILLSSIAYKIFSIDYTLHLVYDKNISFRRQLDQTMVFGLKFDI